MPEHKISYTTQKTYSTLNEMSDDTEYIWFVCHGIGYLSRYFINYFDGLNPQKHFIIAPQAPSKYYQDKQYKYIGASWLTREDTALEMENIKAYFDAIYQNEIHPYMNKKLIVLGYSQGVSVAMRWLAKSRISCDKLLIHSGGIPEELTAKDFEGFQFRPYLIYGKSDPYINTVRAEKELKKAKALFDNRIKVIPFDGKHVVSREVINSFD